MSKRFINCSACGGCHTGRGGQFCSFITKNPTREDAGAEMSAAEDIPERGSEEYTSYSTNKIAEERR